MRKAAKEDRGCGKCSSLTCPQPRHLSCALITQSFTITVLQKHQAVLCSLLTVNVWFVLINWLVPSLTMHRKDFPGSSGLSPKGLLLDMV